MRSDLREMREDEMEERGWDGESVDVIRDSGYIMSLLMVPTHSPSKHDSALL
jgi:hypothetical protein